MIIACTQENLKYGLSLVSPVSSRNINLPILNNILIQAENGAIKFLATNLEIAVSCVIRGKIEKPGSYTVPARLFSDYVQLLPKEKVELAVSEQNKGQESLKISCGNYKTRIKGVSASEFPIVPKVDKNLSYTCLAEDFKKGVGQTIFAVSTNEARPEICGVLMQFQDSVLTLAATDSFRLAEKSFPIQRSNSKKEERNPKVIIPSRTLQEVVRVLGNLKSLPDIENTNEIQISFSDNQMLFAAGQVEITTRLIEGQYPDYKQIIPKQFETQAELSVAEFIGAVRSASLFSRSGVYDVHFEFSPEEKSVHIQSQSAQVGENICKISAQISGKKNNMVLNYRYILDCLQNIGCEDAILKIINDSNPCVFEPKGEKDYLNIIMPIKQ